VRGVAEMASGEDSWQKLKEYGERLAKYIPAEVLVFYTSAAQLILTKDGDAHKPLRLWLFAIVGLISWFGTPRLLGAYSKDPQTTRPNQIIGFVAFAVWAYAYPAGWFAEMKWYDPLYGGLLLLTFTFGIAFYAPKKD
jgi:hypothetical protein